MDEDVDESYGSLAAEILDALPELVVRYRLPDLTIVYCNAAWAAGYGLTPAQVVGRNLHQFLSEDGRVGLERQLARLGPETPLLADIAPRADLIAPDRWIQWVDRYLPTGDVIAVGRDVTERREAEIELIASEARFRELADNSSDIVWRFSTVPAPHLDYVSPSVEKILGYPASIFLDDFNRLFEIVDDDGRARIVHAIAGGDVPERSDLGFRAADGSTVILESHFVEIPDGVQGVSTDVTEVRGLQAELAARALYDALTGLANRHLLNELMTVGLARTEREGTTLAVAFVDLDGFKKVNDDHGHEAGDAVLREVAMRLLAVARSADVVARVGGDEFVIVYEPSEASHDNLIARVERALSAPIEVSRSITVCCPASVGYADTRTCGYDATALLAAADTAMYQHKRTHQRARSALDI